MRSLLVVVGIALVVSAVIVAGAFFAFGQDDNEDNKAASDVTTDVAADVRNSTPPATVECGETYGGRYFGLDDDSSFDEAVADAEDAYGTQLPIPDPPPWAERFAGREEIMYARVATTGGVAKIQQTDERGASLTFASDNEADPEITIRFQPLPRCEGLDGDTISVGGVSVKLDQTTTTTFEDDVPRDYDVVSGTFSVGSITVIATTAWDETVAPEESQKRAELEQVVRAVLNRAE